MKTNANFKMVIALFALMICSSIPCASATILATQGDADGMIGKDWYSGAYRWVVSGDLTVNAYHDGGNRWLYRGLVIINISSLAGQTIENATFNFYSNGFSGTNLQFAGNTGPVLITGYSDISGSNIASLDGSTGWKSYDVKSYIQSAADNSYQYVGFVFNAVVNYGGGSIASAESGNAAYLNVVPEPATVCILSLGTLSLIRRKK